MHRVLELSVEQLRQAPGDRLSIYDGRPSRVWGFWWRDHDYRESKFRRN